MFDAPAKLAGVDVRAQHSRTEAPFDVEMAVKLSLTESVGAGAWVRAIKRVDVARAISRPRPAVFMLGWKGEFLGGETHIKHSDENGSVYVYRGKLYKRHSGISISPACCANASNTCI
jgi:hypothetical protein